MHGTGTVPTMNQSNELGRTGTSCYDCTSGKTQAVGSKAVLLEAVVDCERKQSERDEATERGEVCRHRRCCFYLLCL